MSSLIQLFVLLTVLCSCAAAAANGYATQGLCGGLPKVQLQTPPGLCVGLVGEHLGFARGIAEIGHDIYVLDMGGWREGHGRLLRLGHDGHDAPQTLLTKLDEAQRPRGGTRGRALPWDFLAVSYAWTRRCQSRPSKISSRDCR